MWQEPDKSAALGGDHAEFVLDGEFRDAVAVHVMSSHVDQPLIPSTKT